MNFSFFHSEDAEIARKEEEKQAKLKRKAAEKAAKEEEARYLANLQKEVDDVFAGNATPLTREHLEIILPKTEVTHDGFTPQAQTPNLHCNLLTKSSGLLFKIHSCIKIITVAK